MSSSNEGATGAATAEGAMAGGTTATAEIGGGGTTAISDSLTGGFRGCMRCLISKYAVTGGVSRVAVWRA